MQAAAKTLSQAQIEAAKKRVAGLKMLNSMKNPEAFLKMAASNNPLISQALTMGAQNGGNYDSLTAMILKNAGYDVAAVQKQLSDAGIF